jgi:tetratricopeptide (TPR) repeat protein
MGLMGRARVHDSLNKRTESRQFAVQAIDALKPLMAAPDPSVSLRRAYGLAMIYFGFSQLRSDQEEMAVKSLGEAREAYRSIDGLQVGDLPSAAAYAEASAWQVQALQSLARHDEARRVGEDAAAVAGRVLEKRPGHMGAIRARALIVDSLAGSEADTLHFGKAVDLVDSGGRDWEAIVKIDPSNQIAVNNLVNARLTSGFYSLRMGRISETLRQYRAALAVERQAKPSAMIGSTLSIPAIGLVAVEADLGNRQAAEAALVEYERLNEMGFRDLPADSFGRGMLREFGAFGLAPLGRYAIPVAAGDYATVRDKARASLQRSEAVKPTDSQQELAKLRGLVRTYAVLADASYNLKDYAAAEREVRLAIESRRKLPKLTLQDELDASDELILAAMIAARLERYSDAQQIIEPVLKLHRGLHARGNDDLNQRVQLARALYASALATPGQRRAQLAEAAALLDALPPMMRQLRSTALVRGWIAEEQKKA